MNSAYNREITENNLNSYKVISAKNSLFLQNLH